MKFLLDDGKTAIGYNNKFREYYIEMKKSNGYQIIRYCPWCGQVLPPSLREIWFDIMENEFGVVDVIDDYKKIPPQFNSDAWWIERDL